MTGCHQKHKYVSLASWLEGAHSGDMNSITSTATLATATLSTGSVCCAPVAPAPTLLTAQSGTGRTTTARSGTGTVPTRMAASLRTLAGWLPMSVSSTPSAQAISTLSQRDRFGERG